MGEVEASYRAWAALFERWQAANAAGRAARASVVHQYREFARGQGEPPLPSVLEECDRLEETADRLANEIGDLLADSFSVMLWSGRQGSGG